MANFDAATWVSSVNKVHSLVMLAKKYNGIIEEQTSEILKVKFSSGGNCSRFCIDLKKYGDYKYKVQTFSVSVFLI